MNFFVWMDNNEGKMWLWIIGFVTIWTVPFIVPILMFAWTVWYLTYKTGQVGSGKR